MNSLNRNFIIFFLITCVAGIFLFHWFFVDEMMPARECLSTNCVYVSIQTIPQEAKNILLIVLLIILFIAFLPPTKLLDNKFKRIHSIAFLKWKIDGFSRKLISWLKILEKRDPQIAGCPLGLVARISDFRQ